MLLWFELRAPRCLFAETEKPAKFIPKRCQGPIVRCITRYFPAHTIYRSTIYPDRQSGATRLRTLLVGTKKMLAPVFANPWENGGWAASTSRRVGLDGASRVLRIAKDKAERSGVDLALNRAMAFQLPYADGCFDRVLSTLLFHHLGKEEKRRTLREVWRVLRPAGELHIADWGKAEDWRMRTAFLLVQLLNGFERTTDNVRGVLPELLSQAGFEGVCESDRCRTVFETLSLYLAQKPPVGP